MGEYKMLDQQVFISGEFSLVPIRSEDRYNIMQWRNEQMYHLRQNKTLTEEKQDTYFSSVVSELFEQENPGQILFSYLEREECIGYGGLVHINWVDKNAEVSFIIKTELEEKHFRQHWRIFLELIEEVAFKELKLHKLFTYAFDLRPKIYEVLEFADYKKEAVLEEHCFYNNEYIDVIIHSKFNKLENLFNEISEI